MARTTAELRGEAEPPPCEECYEPTVESSHNGIYVCLECERSLTLGVTDHVTEDRWKPRSDDPEYGILTAWNEGLALPYEAKYEHNLVCDEVRYHHQTTTVLLRDGNAIVTAIDYRTARHGIHRAVIKAMIQNDVDTRVLTEALQMANIGQYVFQLIAANVSDDEEEHNVRAEPGNSPGFAGTDTPVRHQSVK